MVPSYCPTSESGAALPASPQATQLKSTKQVFASVILQTAVRSPLTFNKHLCHAGPRCKLTHFTCASNAMKTLPTIWGLNCFSFLNLCIFTLPSIFSWELLLNYFAFIKHQMQTVADHLYYREENCHRAAVHKHCHCICWKSLQKNIMKTQW